MSARNTASSGSTLVNRGAHATPRARSRTPQVRRSSSSQLRRRHSQSGSSFTPLRGPSGPATGALPALGSIRLLVLARLAEIEDMLVDADSDDASSPERAQASRMVEKLREEVLDRLPAISLDTSALEELLAHHLPWTVADIRAQMESLSTRLPPLREFSNTIMSELRADMPAWAVDIAEDWKRAVGTVRSKLEDLENSLEAMKTPMRPSALVSELLDRIAASDVFDEYRETEATNRAEREMAVAIESEVEQALRASGDGERRIAFNELPHLWQNNDYVHYGYRFIPLSRWPKLLLSAFTLHNETFNIHTHFVPLVASFYSCSLLGPHSDYIDAPDMIYTQFARLCLLTSAIWHVFSGCAHPRAMEFFARLDYVGIGWLISASIATIVYYGWSCHPITMYCYLAASLASAVSGSFLPFMTWFNERKHKKWRLLYFILLSLTGFTPMVHLAFLNSPWKTLVFVSPIFPSLASYLVGVGFYASHFPECMYSYPADTHNHHHHHSKPHASRPAWADRLDSWGLNSHAIWHLCILGGIWLHRRCVHQMSGGFVGDVCEGVLG